MDDVILQRELPFAPWLEPAAWRLPGVQPLAPEDWLLRDEACAGQMRLRDRLMSEKRDLVHAMDPAAGDAAAECLDHVLDALGRDPAYAICENMATRPDGVRVPIDQARPLLTIGSLMQADVCLMQPGPDGHALTGAILCFPANWTLAEKMGKPLAAIHGPVEAYDPDIARRVQRLFDAMRPGQILWRANAFLHRSSALFTPRHETDRHDAYPNEEARFIRSERQTLRKLPATQAVVFTIHTIVVPLAGLTPDQRNALAGSGIKTA